MGRFEPTHDPLALLATMAEVLRLADADHPESVTQREYDAARVAAGFAASPRADRLARRFKVPWPTLCDRVLTRKDPAHVLTSMDLRRVRRVLTRAEVVSAVRKVAASLDTDTITQDAYERGRVVLDEAANRRHLHGAQVRPLPSVAVFRGKFPFADIVREAGLTATTAGYRQNLTRADAVVAFLEHYGFLPRKVDLEWFGSHHRIQMVGLRDGPHSQALAGARAQFHSQGRWFPPEASARARPEAWQHLADDSNELAALAVRYPRKATRADPLTLAQVRAAISTAYDLTPPGQRLTAARYRAISPEHALPSLRIIHDIAKRHDESFARLVRDEAARLAASSRA